MIPFMPLPSPPISEAIERQDSELQSYGFYTPDQLDPYLDNTGLTSCCIYTVIDYGLGNDYQPGDALRCPRGHVNVIKGDDGRWRAIEEGDAGAVPVAFSHPAWGT